MDSIKRKNENLSKLLDSPGASKPKKTFNQCDSINLLERGLIPLQTNFKEYNKYDNNLLSCMALHIKHLHSTISCKQGFHTLLQYAPSFAINTRESWKSLTQWSTYYLYKQR